VLSIPFIPLDAVGPVLAQARVQQSEAFIAPSSIWCAMSKIYHLPVKDIDKAATDAFRVFKWRD
jgi:hypothetical protein